MSDQETDETEEVEEVEETEEVEEVEEVEETEEVEEVEEVEETEEVEEGEEVEEEGGIQEGDFIRIEYTAKTEDGTIIDTTDAEIAEEEGMETEGRDFGPQMIILGEGHVFPAVEDDIRGKEVGYSDTVTIPAEDAFGEHNPEEVETISAKKIDEDDRYPGAQVEIDGRQGYIETIIGGRARVDFNHPLAGQEITYDFEVVEEVDDDIERAKGIVRINTGIEVDLSKGTETKTVTRVEENDEGEEEEIEDEEEVDVFYIEATPELTMNQNWMFSKQQIADDLMHRFDVDRVVVRESFDHGDMHGGMPGMGGMMGGGGMEAEDLGLEDVDMDEMDVEDLEEELDLEGEDLEE